MLSSLLISLLFESVEPSYGTFVELLPSSIVVEAMNGKNTEALKPVKKTNSLAPLIKAESVYSIDLKSGAPLLVRDIFSRRPIASIAKLITAMVILDGHKLDEKAVVSKNATQEEGSEMGLRDGEEITIANLLTGLLVNSGNDAAIALAEFDAGSESEFVQKMNAKAVALGLKDTHFSNAKGFDEPGNYSSAYDTMIFSRAALDYPFIKKTVALKETAVASTNGKIKHRLESTNALLDDEHFAVIGLKTGRTPAAGQSFVSLFKGPGGHEVLSVVLDSPSRFKETKILIDWIVRNYEFL